MTGHSGSRQTGVALQIRSGTCAVLAPLVAFFAALAGCASTVSGTPVIPPDTVTVTARVTVTATGGQAASTIGTQAPGSSPAPAIRTDPLTTPDPCALLTLKEANQLAGRALQAGAASGPAGGSATMCQFTSDPNEPGVAQVTIQVGDGVKKYLDIDKDTLGHPFTEIDDLGDEAWQEDDAIFVRQGNLWIGITLVLLNDPAENAEPLRAAATIAVGRA